MQSSPVIGIQGSLGSFNHKAIANYLNASSLPNPYEIAYLDNTERVISALRKGDVQLGQFAILNNNGGIVEESLVVLQALATELRAPIGLFVSPILQLNEDFRIDPEAVSDALMRAWGSVLRALGGEIVSSYTVEVGHDLMLHPDATIDSITEIRTHQQVALQCASSLSAKYPHITLTPLVNEDAGSVAQKIRFGELPPTVATLGNGVIASINGLQIADKNLQDNKNNKTTMMLVELTRAQAKAV